MTPLNHSPLTGVGGEHREQDEPVQPGVRAGGEPAVAPPGRRGPLHPGAHQRLHGDPHRALRRRVPRARGRHGNTELTFFYDKLLNDSDPGETTKPAQMSPFISFKGCFWLTSMGKVLNSVVLIPLTDELTEVHRSPDLKLGFVTSWP